MRDLQLRTSQLHQGIDSDMTKTLPGHSHSRDTDKDETKLPGHSHSRHTDTDRTK